MFIPNKSIKLISDSIRISVILFIFFYFTNCYENEYRIGYIDGFRDGRRAAHRLRHRFRRTQHFGVEREKFDRNGGQDYGIS